MRSPKSSCSACHCGCASWFRNAPKLPRVEDAVPWMKTRIGLSTSASLRSTGVVVSDHADEDFGGKPGRKLRRKIDAEFVRQVGQVGGPLGRVAHKICDLVFL